MLQRACACGGGCPLCEEKEKKQIQMKLAAGQSGDPYEQEADRAADRVMSGPAAGPAAPKLQRPAASNQVAEVPGEIAGRIESQRGRGEPLPDHVAMFMEQRFGCDFGGVRVHHDALAAELARSVQARAFTTGRDVFFGAGQFVPESGAGQRLIAHELAHTVQQGSQPAPSLQRQTLTLTAADLGSITPLWGLPEEVVSLVAKANLALWRGRPGINRRAIISAFNRASSAYDTDTGNGCNAAQQAAWENTVRQQFLPSITF